MQRTAAAVLEYTVGVHIRRSVVVERRLRSGRGTRAVENIPGTRSPVRVGAGRGAAAAAIRPRPKPGPPGQSVDRRCRRRGAGSLRASEPSLGLSPRVARRRRSGEGVARARLQPRSPPPRPYPPRVVSSARPLSSSVPQRTQRQQQLSPPSLCTRRVCTCTFCPAGLCDDDGAAGYPATRGGWAWRLAG